MYNKLITNSMEKDIFDLLNERDNLVDKIRETEANVKINGGNKKAMLEEMNYCLIDLNEKINPLQKKK